MLQVGSQKDFKLCLRVRHLLPHEADLKAASIVATGHRLSVFRSRPGFKEEVKITESNYNADYLLTDDFAIEGNTLYKNAVAPLVQDVINGGLACLLAYGQTNSGKTTAMTYLTRQLSPALFSTPNTRVEVKAIEILGKDVTDLLDCRKKVKIFEDATKQVHIQSKSIEVASEDAFNELMAAAWSQRKTAATSKNAVSSRSHALIVVTVYSTEFPSLEPGQLTLVDLAGSERAGVDSKTHDTERKKESMEINKSLMNLKECIQQRFHTATGKAVHISFRACPLTHALKQVFDLYTKRSCACLMIATLSPLEMDVSATLNTLRYASLLYQTPQKNSKPPTDEEIMADPSLWSHAMLLEWLRNKVGEACIHDITKVFPYETGLQASRLSELEFSRRLIEGSEGRLGAKRAQAVFLSFWERLIKARTRSKKQMEQEWKLRKKEKEDTYYQFDLNYTRIIG